MKPRVTISLNNDGILEIWINESGREVLVKEIEKLDKNNEHFGLSIIEPTDLVLSDLPYREDDRIIKQAKFMLRLDTWDKENFPHVVDPPAA